MTLAFQLNDIREGVYEWMKEEIRWTLGDTRLGNVLYGQFWLQVQSLRVSLSENGFGELAGDVREHWKAAVAELNADSLYDLLNSTYKRTPVSPYDVCWDCWPANGPEQVERFLHSLGGFLVQFNKLGSPNRYSSSRQPKEWKPLVWPKENRAVRDKRWTRLRKQHPGHFTDDPVVSGSVSISEWLADQLKLELPEFATHSLAE